MDKDWSQTAQASIYHYGKTLDHDDMLWLARTAQTMANGERSTCVKRSHVDRAYNELVRSKDNSNK